MGWAAISTRGSFPTSRATTTFCWFPPESDLRERLRAAAAHVELLQEPGGALDQAPRPKPAEARVRRPVEVVERDVLGERELEHEPAPLASSGMWPTPASRMRCVLAAREVTPGDREAAALERAQARQRLDELRLAVAVDAGDADDLTGADLERDAAHRVELAIVEHVEILDLEQRLAGHRSGLLDAQENVATDHQARELRLGRTRGGQRLDLLPAPEHRDAVGDLEHLVQLVADEDDRHALARRGS